MKALRRLGFKDLDSPCISRDAGRSDLAHLFAKLGYTAGAEIGVWMGLYSEQLCRVNPGLHLTCVDAWTEYQLYHEKKNDQARLDAAYVEATDRLRPFACTILRMSSEDGAAMVPDGSLDFVYLDANHAEAYVRQDLELWTPKVRRGGCVSGHDYIIGVPTRKHKHLEVTPAVNAFAAAHQIAPIYVTAKDKSPSFFWIVQ